MKKLFRIVSLLMVLLFAIATPASMNADVFAQDPNTCYDATGAVIPCPSIPGGGGNEDEEESTNGGNQNPPASVNTPIPTASFTPEPTATPLPIALPESDYLGSCTSANFGECKDQFQCEDGLLVIKVDLYSENGTKYDFYCIPHETVPTIDFPLTKPDGTGVTEDTNWTSGCVGDDVDACVENLAALCDADGGDLSVWYEDDGSAGAYCENSTPADSQPAPTEAPSDLAAAPTIDDGTEGSSWDEECGYWTCWISSLSCMADGGSGYELDHASGAHVYHCDVPSNAKPASTWLPWLAIGGGVILVAILLPAVQKVRDAAARSRVD